MKTTWLQPDISGLVDWPLLHSTKHTVVTVGTFDGMHKGHQAVVRRVVGLAKSTGSLSAVIMFDRRPGFVHGYAASHDGEDAPENLTDNQRLTSVTEQLRVLDSLNVDHVLVVHYTLAFAAKSYRFFLGQLVGKLGMRTLVLGSDATMGAGRSGGIEEIDRLAQATRLFELDVVKDLGSGLVRVPRHIVPQAPPSDNLGEPEDPRKAMNKAELRSWSKASQAHETRVWSSSNVRYLLSQGCVKAVDGILGRPQAVEGVVVKGEQRGRTMGFPTANLGGWIDGYVPVDGVYAGWLVDLGPVSPQEPSTGAESGDAQDAEQQADTTAAPMGRQQQEYGVTRSVDFSHDRDRIADGSPYRWLAAISIGTKPTYRNEVGQIERIIEPYAITDDWLDLYGHRVRVEFAGFLRSQVAFSGTDELVAAMKDYVNQTKQLIG